MPVPPSKAIHRGCYRVDADGEEVMRGKNIREAKLKAVEYLKTLNYTPEIKIYYLPAYIDPIEVDSDLSVYQ